MKTIWENRIHVSYRKNSAARWMRRQGPFVDEAGARRWIAAQANDGFEYLVTNNPVPLGDF